MIDTVALVSMLRRSAQDQWFRDFYGEKVNAILAMLEQYEQEGWQRLTKYLTNEQISELHSAIDRWRERHSAQRYVAATVDQDQFPDAIEISGGVRTPGSVFRFLFLDPLAGLDPAMRQVELSRQTAERVFFYMQRMPMLVSWQVDLMYRRLLLVPQTKAALEDVRRFSESTARFSEASSEFATSSRELAKSLSEFPAYLTQERERAVLQIASETEKIRQSSIADLANAVARERSTMLSETNEYLTQQRDALTKQLAETVGVRTDAAVEKARLSLDATIDHLFYRLLQYTLLIAGLILAFRFFRSRWLRRPVT